MLGRAYLLLLPFLIGCLTTVSGAAPAQDIAAFRAARDAYIDNFRRTGQRPLEPALDLEQDMLTALEMVPTENRGALLFEIASIQRLQGRFEEAVATYQAALAEDSSGEVTFDAWIGIARAHAYGTKDHGAADEALQQALRSRRTGAESQAPLRACRLPRPTADRAGRDRGGVVERTSGKPLSGDRRRKILC